MIWACTVERCYATDDSRRVAAKLAAYDTRNVTSGESASTLTAEGFRSCGVFGHRFGDVTPAGFGVSDEPTGAAAAGFPPAFTRARTF